MRHGPGFQRQPISRRPCRGKSLSHGETPLPKGRAGYGYDPRDGAPRIERNGDGAPHRKSAAVSPARLPRCFSACGPLHPGPEPRPAGDGDQSALPAAGPPFWLSLSPCSCPAPQPQAPSLFAAGYGMDSRCDPGGCLRKYHSRVVEYGPR